MINYSDRAYVLHACGKESIFDCCRLLNVIEINNGQIENATHAAHEQNNNLQWESM